MIDFDIAIELIRRNGGFKPNKRDTSYYRTYTTEGNRPLQARVSNYGTSLWTWYDKDYDPSYAINACVVFSENGEYDSDVSVDMNIKDKEGNVIGQKKSFEVKQYVYNCQLLDINDAALINQQVQSIWQNKGFNAPLANTPKHAKVMILRPNDPIKPIIENKHDKNMNKKLIRLTESDLHKVIKESVNKVLTELDWRTYANAGKKAHGEVLDKMKRGTSLDDLHKDSTLMKRVRQARKFGDQAVASSRDKFKGLNDNENDFYTTVGPDDTYYANVENDSWDMPMVADKDGKSKIQGLSRPKMVNVNPERYFGYGNNKKVSDWNNFAKEISDFNNGKSRYVKGKGWQ